MQVEDLTEIGQRALLRGDYREAVSVLNAAVFLDPSHAPYLWQRGLSLYYMGRYGEGMAQFESDMDVNGSDPEEVLWHFICKASLLGYKEALKDGFLPLSHSRGPPTVPMSEVLLLYKKEGTVDDVLKASTSQNGKIVPSYNGEDALGYAHFYIGMYYQLLGSLDLAWAHFKQAVQRGNSDFMGRLMAMHLKLFERSYSRKVNVDNPNPVIIYGGWQLSQGHSGVSQSMCPSDIIPLLLNAIDNGIRAFDCGDIYTGVEELYGRMLEAHSLNGGRREDILIHTKLIPDIDVIRKGRVNESYIRGIVRRSLSRLGTSYIDLVQFHWWEWSCTGYMAAAKTLKCLQGEGLIRKVGLTNFDLEHTQELLSAGLCITSIQVQLSLLDHRPINSGLVSLCLQHNISILAYGVLAGGFLTDQWIGQSKPTKFSNRSLIKYQLIIDEFGSWELFQELLHTLKFIAARHSPLKVSYCNGETTFVDHVTVAMVAIAYVLGKPAVAGVILGSLNTRHVKESTYACQLKLTKQDLDEISLVLARSSGPLGVVYGLECDIDSVHGRIMKYNLNQLNGPTHLDELCTRFLELYFSAYPDEATRSGYRQQATPTKNPSSTFDLEQYNKCTVESLSYDHLLNISSKEEIELHVTRLKALLEEANDIVEDELTTDQRVDLKIIIAQLNLELVKWLEVKMHEKDPAIYLSFDAVNYFLPVWGPDDDTHPGVAGLSVPHCLTALKSRLSAIPLQLQNGMQNLSRPVLALTERSIKLCKSFEVFLRCDVKTLLSKLSSFDECSFLAQEVAQSSIIASQAVARFKELLERDVLPNATNSSLAVGKEVYDKLLYYGHFIKDSSSLLQLGEDFFASVKKQLEELALQIDPTKSWSEITEDVIRSLHPTSDELLSSYMSEIGRAKDHMIQHSLMPKLPDGEKVLGFYTPEFLVPFSPFGDFLNPIPFTNGQSSRLKSHTGYLMLHFVENHREDLLRAHDYTWISVIAPHECYPGHHVQALLAQEHPRILRKFHQSAYFYEGWGLYCEELAYETGFFEKGLEIRKDDGDVHVSAVEYARLARLTQLRLQLWRAARIIMDMRLHREEMTVEDCRDFLCREVMFNPQSAVGEVFMYVSRPTYAPCYIAGYVEIMKLRERYKRKCVDGSRDFDLGGFHEALIRNGSIPLCFFEECL